MTIQIPKSWSMCTNEEANDRQVHMEVSEFESTSETFDLPPSQRIVDPMLCVKKYRRSAAGGGTLMLRSSSSSSFKDNENIINTSMGSKDKSIRTISQLDLTVEHLLKTIFCHQKSHHEAMKARTLSKTAAFVDDRLRAVQVDYVVGHSLVIPNNHEYFTTVQRFHLRMIRYNILIGYLMCDPHVSPSQFEHKFNAHALQSSMSNFFHLYNTYDWNGHFRLTHRDLEILDEVMCYSSLLHVSSVLFNDDDIFDVTSRCMRRSLFQGRNTLGILLHSDIYLYFKGMMANDADVVLTNKDGNPNESFPKWKFALQLANTIAVGNYMKCLSLLMDGIDSSKLSSEEQPNWLSLARCILSPILPLIRLGLLRQYNKSFGKAENAPGANLAQLMRFSKPEQALQFCEIIGLPLSEDKSKAIFKIAPIDISINNDVNIVNSFMNKRDDEFVFSGYSNSDIEQKWRFNNRVDSDDIMIPSSELLWNMLQ